MNKSFRMLTLLELLIVIAAIGILFTILLPAIGRALEAGRFSVCKSNQKQIGAMSIINYDDYQRLPYAGWIDLYGESDSKRGLSYEHNDQQVVSGWSSAIIHYSGLNLRIDNAENHEEDATKLENLKSLSCPSTQPDDYMEAYQIRTNTHSVKGKSAYLANDAVYGREGNYRIDGMMSKIGKVSEVMLHMDGQANSSGNPYISIYNKSFDKALADCLLGNEAGRLENFDLLRHYGKSAIVFADGHVDSILLKLSQMENVIIAESENN